MKRVHVKFLDHCDTTGLDVRPIPCEAFGYLVKEDQHTITLCSWLSDNDFDSPHSSLYVIVKHRGLTMKVLK